MHRSLRRTAWAVTAATAVLACICILWELWLAPLRPGGSWLVLKAAPLALALPGMAKQRTRTFRWWSMAILAYVCEGAVRLMSDRGLGAAIAGLELALSVLIFAAILHYMRLLTRQAQSTTSAV